MKRWKLYIPIYGLFYMRGYIRWWVNENWARPDYWDMSPFNVVPWSWYQSICVALVVIASVELFIR